MKQLTVLWQSMLLIALGLCIPTTTTIAQDMAKVAPGIVKVLLDNDHVRVLDVQAKAGDKLPMHSHSGYVLYSMGNGTVKTTLADGKVADTKFKDGEARWSDAIVHANEAATDVHVLVIEMKEKEMVKEKTVEKKTIKKTNHSPLQDSISRLLFGHQALHATGDDHHASTFQMLHIF